MNIFFHLSTAQNSGKDFIHNDKIRDKVDSSFFISITLNQLCLLLIIGGTLLLFLLFSIYSIFRLYNNQKKIQTLFSRESAEKDASSQLLSKKKKGFPLK